MTFDTKSAIQYGQTVPFTMICTAIEIRDQLNNSRHHVTMPRIGRTLFFAYPRNPHVFIPLVLSILFGLQVSDFGLLRWH